MKFRIRTLLPLLMLALAVPSLAATKPLKAPAKGKIRVAFVMTEGATMIDFAGPWEVFQDVHVHSRGQSMDEMMPFELYTVSDSTAPIRASGGMKVVPDYTWSDAPRPHVVVVGAQRGNSDAMMHWLRENAKTADIVMSVCTGAFKLGRAGLLDGKPATTHHDFYDSFAEQFPKAKLVRSTRFVQSDDRISTAGGLTSGIDLALHVVERYFGRAVAQQTADYMEYESDGWKR